MSRTFKDNRTYKEKRSELLDERSYIDEELSALFKKEKRKNKKVKDDFSLFEKDIFE